MKSSTPKILIQRGDLTEMDVDAIVNAANNDLLLGGGVAGALRRKGGEKIQRECNEIGTIPVGFAAVTTAGSLKARHIIHAASMELGGATHAEALRGSTAHSLRIASEHAFKTIAFPAIGTGIGGFPVEECAQIMLSEALQHLKTDTSLTTIYFVLYDEASRKVFDKVWKKLRANTAPNATEAAGAD